MSSTSLKRWALSEISCRWVCPLSLATCRQSRLGEWSMKVDSVISSFTRSRSGVGGSRNTSIKVSPATPRVKVCTDKDISHCVSCNTQEQCLHWETHWNTLIIVSPATPRGNVCTEKHIKTLWSLCLLKHTGAVSALRNTLIIVSPKTQGQCLYWETHQNILIIVSPETHRGSVCIANTLIIVSPKNQGQCLYWETHWNTSITVSPAAPMGNSALRNLSAIVSSATPRGSVCTEKHISHCNVRGNVCIEKHISHCVSCNNKGQCLHWATSP